MTIKRTRIAKISIVGLLLIVSLLILGRTFVKAGNGIETLPIDSYYVMIIPETKLVIIRTYDAWVKIVKYHYPKSNPKNILGIAVEHVTNKNNGYSSYYTILIPIAHPNMQKWKKFEEVIGHETLHVTDFHIREKVFDPDEQRKKEEGSQSNDR